MRIAWFRPAPATAIDARQTAAFLAELSRAHSIDVFDRRSAHDFPWKHFRSPYDLCWYELADEPGHDFVAAYLFHYPGLLHLHGDTANRFALAASRLVVVGDAATAEQLAITAPDARVRVVPPFADAGDDAVPVHERGSARFAVLDPACHQQVTRAMQRANDAGAHAMLLPASASADVDAVLRESDVIVAVEWPDPQRSLTSALLGMSARKAVIVLERESTAAWPALDPQTWQPRGFEPGDAPIVVSIDPRDEEHSLALAIRRLSGDSSLRTTLGAAARRWWEAHATPAHAAAAWHRVLEEARTMPAPRPQNLPASLTADGTERAREILAPFGVVVDFLES